MRTCGDCENAFGPSGFTLTPKGRIKKDSVAVCAKQGAIRHEEINRKLPPCVTRQHVHIGRVWPDYDASDCKHWELRK